MRVRFAPSPTGHLHVGNARTALFNWLLARGQGGTYIVRIEDTDADRSTRESEASIVTDLRWLGLDWDEGPDVGGPRGPYRQSEPRIAAGERPAIRFRVPEERDVMFTDAVRGDVRFETDVIGDPVIVRADGHPAYNFAVVVDDALMEVTHVVRGEDHISNTPRQILLYEALGF